MKEFCIAPRIISLDTIKEFKEKFLLRSNDLILTNKFLYDVFFRDIDPGMKVIFYEDYGKGEPTDLLVEAILKDLDGFSYDRVFGVGGGAILDVAKLFALREITPIVDVFEKRIPANKAHELYLLPTTCGTGSEVTNISILALTSRNTKFGLADKALYADAAILLPELLGKLPYSVFATSSIDALIHACESFTSPKASDFTRMYSKAAITMILTAYQTIRDTGHEVLPTLFQRLLLASTYAGIAFSNAGCALVHAMSYPLGATYHVPHGESNYVFFTDVYKYYMTLDSEGSIKELNQLLSSILSCKEEDCYEALDTLLSCILPKKKMKEYGVTKKECEVFAQSVIERQGRLLANNYKAVSQDQIVEIYHLVYE